MSTHSGFSQENPGLFSLFRQGSVLAVVQSPKSPLSSTPDGTICLSVLCLLALSREGEKEQLHSSPLPFQLVLLLRTGGSGGEQVETNRARRQHPATPTSLVIYLATETLSFKCGKTFGRA